MTPTAGNRASSRAAPIAFEAPAGWCTGWFHAARAPARSVAVVMCAPLGYEALCSYAAYRQIAEALAEAGFDVVRFDYHGTGDSAGGDADADRVPAWLASIASAMVEAMRLSGSRQVALFGMRLGATLAIEAAMAHSGVASLMLWAPCAGGRAFAREMRAANAQHAAGASTAANGELEALGSLYTAQTLQAIAGLDCEHLATAPAPRVYIAVRDDIPVEGPLPARCRELGIEVECTVWPGYAEMMAEPHGALVDSDALTSMTRWLRAAHPVDEATREPEHTLPAWPRGFALNSLRESPFHFGRDGALFGVLSEPTGSSAFGRQAETAVLMLNVGGNYRVGPNRIYVKAARELAAAGYRVLRLDIAGVGDSRAEPGIASENPYRHDAIGDVRAAIDALVARGCKRFYLVGICSGSYLAFETALADSRVNGQMLLNTRLLEWDADKNGPWQSSMQQHYKSTRYYRRALLRTDFYGRLLRGRVDVRGIAQRLWTLAHARLQRGLERVLRHAPPSEGLLGKFMHLSGRGVDTLLVMSAQDDGLDYVEFHLGRRAARMQGRRGFRMVLIEDSDHTFSTVSSQRAVIGTLRDHLARLHEQPTAQPALTTRIATT